MPPSEEKREESKYEALDNDLVSDMGDGDGQLNRLVRCRLNAAQEKTDAAYVKRMVRTERFEKGQRKITAESDAALAAMAQREMIKEATAAAKRCDDDEEAARRLDRELKDEVAAKVVEHELRGVEDFERGLAEAKDADEAAVLEAKVARARFAERKRRSALDDKADVSVGDRWKRALTDVELEDVGDAIAISARLPSLADVKIQAKGKFVTVVARRAGSALRAANAQAASAGPKEITLKFEMVCVRDARDVLHDYDCESGYLHVFLDGVQLAKLSSAQKKTTLTTLRRRLANAAASKLASLKKAVVGDDAQPDLSLEGLAISRDAF